MAKKKKSRPVKKKIAKKRKPAASRTRKNIAPMQPRKKKTARGYISQAKDLLEGELGDLYVKHFLARKKTGKTGKKALAKKIREKKSEIKRLG
jgi:hypothetical protein